MKITSYLKFTAIFMISLIISLPIIFAEQYSLLYDSNGNLVYDQETDIYREYNELNQLIRTRINNVSGTILQEYTWEPLQERIFIKDEFYGNSSLKSSTYYFGDDYVVIQNSSGTFNRTNIYQDGILVGYEDVDGKKRYVLPDHEGSVHIILNESGNVIEENLFSPFAEPLAGVNINKFGYEVKEYDSLVKDYDFHFRKLRTTGPPIFLQPDTLISNVYDPQLLNRYAFERNNPYKYTDPTGHYNQEITTQGSIGIGGGLLLIGAGLLIAGTGGSIIVAGGVVAALVGAGHTILGLAAPADGKNSVINSENVNNAFDIAESGPEGALVYAGAKYKGIPEEDAIDYAKITQGALEIRGLKGAYGAGENIVRGYYGTQIVKSSVDLTKNTKNTPSGGGCKNCVTTDKKGVQKIAEKLKQDVAKSLTEKINKNKNKK